MTLHLHPHLHLHLATDTGLLADRLATMLADPLPDPFAEELVVVPAKGVERWLTQRLSHRLGAHPDSSGSGADGVCAGVRFVNPRSLVAMLTGTEREDPWDPDRLVWPLLAVIDASMDEPWCRTLARHLGQGDGQGLGTQVEELRRDRRYSVARRLAGLYASYAVQRPVLLREWRSGRDTDGLGLALPADLCWQAELWRRLLDHVGTAPPDQRQAEAQRAIADGAPLALPDRLSLFGHTRMPVTELELLRAVAEVREVHLFLPQVSPTAWRALAEQVDQGPVRRVQDTSARLVRHPLLASLGRDSRELQRSLSLLGATQLGPDSGGPEPAESAPAGQALLGLLQHDLRHDAPGDPTRTVDPADRSIQVHACHGPTRQVEVLREVLAGLMEDDPTLEPRDILVMCPDVEAYAPLFSAAFGLGPVEGGGADDLTHPAHQLRVRLADRGLLSTNPLLSLASALVDLAAGRAKASEVLDLAAAAPVRHRFRLTDDELSTVTRWTEQSGVRWGLTGPLRAGYQLADFPQNTWQAGLDRVLLGVAKAEECGRHLGGTLPLDDVGSAAIDLAGRFAELVERVEHTVVALREATTLSQWLTALRDGVLSLGSVPDADTWQVAQLERELDGLHDARGEHDPRLRLADVRSLLEDRTRPRPTRANFRTGTLTVATLVPMRSVPHRVVCLLGLDDGVFPRSTVTDGDDVLARDPVTGERDPRSEDRQLLLDAVLAAQETLVVTYTGANEHSGQARPPAVPLGELLDALESTAAGARSQVLVRHPLQPFDPRNFDGAAPFSFDRASLAGAQTALGERRSTPALLGAPLPPRPEDDIALAELRAFVVHPVREFLRQRLDVGIPQAYDEIDDALPTEIDALTEWTIGDRVLRAVIAGADRTGVLLAEQLRGDLPPLRLGERTLRAITLRAGQLLEATQGLRTLDPRSVDVTVALEGGRRLTGVVPDVRGDRIVRVHYGKLSAKHRLASWVDLLALSAALPDRAWSACTVGWHSTGPRMSQLGPVDHSATSLLHDLVLLRDEGRCSPLPLPVRTAYAWADALRARKDPYWPARNAWETPQGSPVPGEQDDPAHVRVHGRSAPFEVLRDELEPWARRLWDPLFAHEEMHP